MATPTRAIQTAKLVSLLGSVIVALSAGSNYAFSSFAPQLQESLHLTSTQINLVGIAGNAGVYLSGPLWGKYIDKRGPRIALISAALLVLLGYLGLAAAYTAYWPIHSTASLFFLNLLTGLGNNGGFTAAMNAQAKSWGGERRGTATALVLSGFGLSAFLYSSLSHALFPGNTGGYLMLLAFGSMTSMLVGLALIRIIPPTEVDGRGAYEAIADVSPDADLETSATVNRTRRSSSASRTFTRRRTSSDIGARASVWQPDSLSADASEDEADGQNHVVAPTQNLPQDQTPSTAAAIPSAITHPVNDSETKPIQPGTEGEVDICGRRLIKQVDFLLLFGLMALVSGAGLLLINNVGTVTRTLWEYNQRKNKDGRGSGDLSGLKLDDKAKVQQLQAHQVSAISICNASGRIMIGLLSDYLVNKTGSPRYRVWLLLVVTTLALLSQTLAALPNTIETVKQLLLVSTLTGLAYGTLFGLCPVLVFEWFGLKHFSQNYGMLSLSPVLAGNVFNLMFGRIYDSNVEPEPAHGGDGMGGGVGRGGQHVHQCLKGEDCYRKVFEITAVGCVLAVLISLALIARRAGLTEGLRRIRGRV
ncbi:MFS general substrate transporter [Violaceomyces palustris]|uniref:MFS general substrate transporter n=1 Tax=Violaceomyces palustris TaxID=1673888 RepID=A0ACD0NRH2_9BASI|nr:MFS general substrate transporter [Violaceomyces palustris]